LSEKSEAKRDGARLQKNSGRGAWQKGDAKTEFFLIDYKEGKKSFTLNLDNWAKVCRDAAKVDVDLHPVLKIILGERQKVRLGILSWDVIEFLVNYYMENENGRTTGEC
jgi:hypothetical protein